MINDVLLSDRYYKNKLPLYLKNDDPFWSHFDIWLTILRQIDTFGNAIAMPLQNTIFTNFDIFSQYAIDACKLADDNSEQIVMLDILAKLFNVSRTVIINNTAITLNNSDLRIYIISKILKNNTANTYSDLITAYSKMNLQIEVSNVFENDVQKTATAKLILFANNISNNLELLFTNGLLTVGSMGIQYQTQILISILTYWDTTSVDDSTVNWDEGAWS